MIAPHNAVLALAAIGLAVMPGCAMAGEADASAAPPASSDVPAIGPPDGGPQSGARSVFDDNWLAMGLGARLDSSYDGSDDYSVRVLPALAGSVGGVQFTPRAAGLALLVFEADLTPDIEIGGGPVGRVRTNRARGIKDPVVRAAGRLGTAIELGATLGITFKRVFTRYDRVSIGSDLRFDVNGAHGGYVIDPSISYRTPLSRGTVLGLSVGAQYGGGGFGDYYFSVTPVQAARSGLPSFSADDGWHKAGGSVSFGVDLDGDFRNGGIVVGLLAGYSRMLGDAARSPYTALRGNADQFSAAAGIGYIF